MLQSRVPAAATGRELAAWLASRFTYLDAAGWCAEIAAGRVSRNGERAGAADLLAAGDVIAYAPPAAPPPPLPPILFADDTLVAVDKPPHLVAHHDGAFGGALFLHALAAALGGGTLHLVHRLDRETSGVLLLARDAAATAALQRQFAAGEATKRYLALVHGVTAADGMCIDTPIGPAAGAVAARRAVLAAGERGARPARTEFTVLERLPAHTLLAATPRTGRTHQIRVHLEHAGHPLLGDVLYGRSDAEYLAYVAHRKQGGGPAWPGRGGVERQMLHAAELRVRHPRSGAEVAFAAPLPADFGAALAVLRAR